jgi:hypothetical protein
MIKEKSLGDEFKNFLRDWAKKFSDEQNRIHDEKLKIEEEKARIEREKSLNKIKSEEVE